MSKALGSGGPAPAGLSDHEQRAFEQLRFFYTKGIGYATEMGLSSGRLYWENTLGFFDVKGATVPAAVTVFPNELYQAPRSWTEQAYPNLIYFNQVDKGNHFAAWQEPELFTTEVRAAFRSLR